MICGEMEWGEGKMRLIDADELIKDRVSNDPVVIAAKCAPTAYDADKVVERLKQHSMPFMYDKNDRDVDLNRAIKIVKSGGIE